MRVTRYSMCAEGTPRRIAFVSDFHDGDPQPLLSKLGELRPDLILVGGDVVHNARHMENGMTLLGGAVAIAPTFCSLGNHEARCGESICQRIAETGARLLDNDYAVVGDLVIGGLRSGFFGKEQGRLKRTPEPALGWLDGFCAERGVRVLLSHHPEYYPRYLKDRPIELVLSGHAHGGQWSLLGQGFFAPGQGLLPRYTAGAYRGRRRAKGKLLLSAERPLLIVSRGLANRSAIPRINNPEEILLLEI